MPVIVRKIGKAYGRILKQTNGVRKTFSAFENEVKSITDLKTDIKEKDRTA